MNREAECIDSQDTNQDTREVGIKLYEHASSFNKYLCEKMMLHEENYVTYLLKKKVSTTVDGDQGSSLLDGKLARQRPERQNNIVLRYNFVK